MLLDVLVYTSAYDPNAMMFLLKSISGLPSIIVDELMVINMLPADLNTFNTLTIPSISDLTIKMVMRV